MDGRLYKAAIAGNVDDLRKLVAEDEQILERVVVGDAQKENALHVAAQFGRLDFANEIMRLSERLACQLNSRGESPLHVACNVCHCDNIETIKSLLDRNTDVCFVRDGEGLTPIHIAAIKGRLDVLEVLISYEIRAAWLLTERGVPLLHLCASNSQFEALKKVVDKIECRDFFNLRDRDGNTILHILVVMERTEEIDLVLEKLNEAASNLVVTTNARNQTAIDVSAEITARCKRWIIRQMLYSVVEVESKTLVFTKPHLKSLGRSSTPSISRYQSKKDHESEENGYSTREALMVVAILITTVSYNAMLNPPGGVVQVDDKPKSTIQTNHMRRPGRSVMSYEKSGVYIAFTACNTIGFLASIVLILVLVSKSRLGKNAFRLSVMATTWTAVLHMIFTYGLTTIFLPAHSLALLVVVTILLGLVVFGIILMVLPFVVVESQPGQMLHHKIATSLYHRKRDPFDKQLSCSPLDHSNSKDGKVIETDV